MKITILTLFPDMFQGPFNLSILKRAQEKGLVQIDIKNIRDFGIGSHKTVDDTPYGGSTGMVMRVDVLSSAIEWARQGLAKGKEYVVLMSARGASYTQAVAKQFSGLEHLILICGHYEGVDERISRYIDEEISIGDFVTTGGEIPAMLIADSVIRLIPGVLKADATAHESFSLTDETRTLLEYPHYTNPRDFQGDTVPEILLSGNHKLIATWRQEQSKTITKKRRPDLLKD
jgi:tRNA (guanine37-N1)-methyltransferase